MARMIIQILGNGGFYNEGLFYNALAINRSILVETPPDILQSLGQQGLHPAQFDTVYISHIHGDHCFGFPFFFFNWLYAGDKESHWKKGSVLTIMGPEGLGTHLESLLRAAIPSNHPYIHAFQEQARIVEIDEGTTIAVNGGLWFGFMRTAHELPTYSLIAGEIAEGSALPSARERFDRALFIYSSDTSMFEGISKFLESGAKLILCDTNGEKEHEVHMSPRELAAAARDRGGDILSGRIRGIHMSRARERAGDLRFVQPGEEFVLK